MPWVRRCKAKDCIHHSGTSCKYEELNIELNEYADCSLYESNNAEFTCLTCCSSNIHYIEFRTDYVNARLIQAMNNNKWLVNDDLPYRLSGYYCHDCQALVGMRYKKSNKTDKEKEIKDMKKPEGWDHEQAVTGDYEILAPGGYICKILQVKVGNNSSGNEMMTIGFDIEEGEHKGYFKRQFDHKKTTNPDAKWPGIFNQNTTGNSLKFFKGMITSIEASNQGYKWDFDETKLKGKLFGAIFGQEEWINSDGEIKLSTKCASIRSVGTIRDGKFKVPDLKKANSSNTNNSSSNGAPNFEVDDNELPF